MKDMSYRRFYLFGFKAKETMGLFFSAYVFLYLLFGYFCGVTSIDLWMALEMLLGALLIGFGKMFILPADKITKGRMGLWVAFSTAVTVATGQGFGWFVAFPGWVTAVFYACVTAGLVALCLGECWRAELDTRNLNQGLQNYKAKK